MLSAESDWLTTLVTKHSAQVLLNCFFLMPQLAITLLEENDMRINFQRGHLVDQLQSSIRRHGPQYA